MTSPGSSANDVLRTYLIALAGEAAVFLLGTAWLYIPESHTWELLLSLLVGSAVLAGFLALHVWVIQRLSPGSLRVLWLSCVILLGWLLLGFALHHAATKLETNIETRAGYWNSQLTAHHRATFTYARLVRWQQLALQVLEWIVIPALLLPFAVETLGQRQRPWAAASSILLSPWLWLTVAAAYVFGSWLASGLLAWHPAHSVRGELVSMVLRISVLFCAEVALLVATLFVTSHLLGRAHKRRTLAAP